MTRSALTVALPLAFLTGPAGSCARDGVDRAVVHGGSTYKVSLQMESESRAGGRTSFGSKFELEGVWRTERRSVQEDLVGFVNLDRATLVITGTVASTPERLEDVVRSEPVRVRRSSTGAVDGLSFSDEQGPMSRVLHELIVLESNLASVVRGPGAPASPSSVVPEPSSSGWGPAEYRVIHRDSGDIQVQRTRAGYDRLRPIGPSEFEESETRHDLQHVFTFDVSAEGELTRVNGYEHLTVRRASGAEEHRRLKLILTKLDSISVEPSLSPGIAEPSPFLEPGSIGADRATRRLLLEQHAAGVSKEHLIVLLHEIAVAGFRKNQRELFFRSVARIELSPEILPELEALVLQYERHVTVRPYVLDLLAGAGTPESLGVLQRFLSSTESRSTEEQRASDWARLTYVHRPTNAFGEFVLGLWSRQAAGEVEHESQVSLLLGVGGVAHALRERYPELSDRFSKRLIAQLETARNPRTQNALLRGLGNARVPLSARVLRNYTESPDSSVRAAAGLGLRHVLTNETEPLVLQLVADRTRAVQTMALKSAGDGKIGPEGRLAIADLVLAGKIHPDNYAPTFELVANVDLQTRRRVARFMLEDQRTMNYLRAGLRAELEKSE